MSIIPSFLKICHLFLFLSVLENLSPFTLTIFFYSGACISINHSHSYFIIKLIFYKSRIYIPLKFTIHFLLHFLKLVLDYMVTKYKGWSIKFISFKIWLYIKRVSVVGAYYNVGVSSEGLVNIHLWQSPKQQKIIKPQFSTEFTSLGRFMKLHANLPSATSANLS